MAELRTEEEQVEAIKQWWNENGKSTLLAIVIAAAAVFGWKGWQQQQQATAEEASALYQNMIQAGTVKSDQSLSEENLKTAQHMANTLKSDFADSVYAAYAALWLAKQAVDTAQLDAAESELRWALEQNPEASLSKVIELRLARVLLEQGDIESALAELKKVTTETHQAIYYETEGDIHLAMGLQKAARESYLKARVAAKSNPSPVVGLKLDDLAATEE